ncbi:MAG: DUF1592 domain-containing protein [Pirellulaceae bacterium]
MRTYGIVNRSAALLLWGLFVAAPSAQAAEELPGDKPVREFLARHCLECHRGEKAEGQLRLDELSFDLSSKADRDRWSSILKRVSAGEMPPEEKPRPAKEDIAALTGWIDARLAAEAARQRAAQGRVVMRRLNRNEYQNTLCDLLGIELELQKLLPEDATADGFDNVGEAMHTSSFLMDRYLEAADMALDMAIANGPRPTLVQKRFLMRDQRQVVNATQSVYLPVGESLVLFSSSPWTAINIVGFYPADRGHYRVRLSGRAYQSDGEPVSLRIEAGPMSRGKKNHLVGYFAFPAEQSKVIEFTDHFEARDSIRLEPYGLAGAKTVDDVGAEEYDGPGLVIDWLDVEGPLYDAWPPESHRRIFGDLPQKPAPIYNQSNRVEVVSQDPLVDAERILRNFARRAYRRPATDDDLAPLMDIVRERLAADYSFEQAVRVGLKAVLVSPDFLFLREKPGRLDDFALASRLSYFLWSTLPDAELLEIAEQGKLREPAVLRRQVERMLADDRASAFTENFVDQWLELRDIDFTEPDRRLYPEFDDALKAAMVEEARRFFEELLKHDLSVANFVDSDFTILNGRLAEHYGISGVAGHEFRRVALPADSHRGGVMTMAGVLKVTANGTTTSPVVRGAWVLENLLGAPPEPPPAGVPAVEPDIRGAVTIREQLAKHRQIGACAACHKKIDPPGFALESFDVIGGWREHYRALGRGEPIVKRGERMRYLRGPAVDPADSLADGRAFQNIDELKQLLLEDKEQFAGALAAKLLTYGAGGAPGIEDRGEIGKIVAACRDSDYGLRSLVHAIVQSPLFQNK